MAMTAISERRPLEKTLSGFDIMIGLEDERGQLAPIDIDEADDVITDDYSISKLQLLVTSIYLTPICVYHCIFLVFVHTNE